MKEGVVMSNQEISQVEIFEKLLRKEIKQKQAALFLKITTRQVRRKLHKYRLNGAKSLVNQARGRTSNNQISQSKLDQAIILVKDKYFDFSPTLAHEKLTREHDFSFSVERLRQEMIKTGLWKAHTRRRAHVHQLRERRACVGELVQLDGSPHDWFEGRAPKCNLDVLIDDASSNICIYFSVAETTRSYFDLLKIYFRRHGLPVAIYVDKHSIFRNNTPINLDHKKPIKDKNADEYFGLTQFARAMKELGIEIIFANTPQAKGRVERMNQTLQDRLVKEMRLRNISSIDEANVFASEFCLQFNKQFTKEAKSLVDRHRSLAADLDLDTILCIKEKRILSKNLTCQYNNQILQVKTERSAYSLRNTMVNIHESSSGEIKIYDQKNKTLDYSAIKKTSGTQAIDSKLVNSRVDAILEKISSSRPWEQGYIDYQKNLVVETSLANVAKAI